METVEPLWVRIVVFVFLGIFLGSAAVLALGAPPVWVERIAAGFLWAIVVLLYAALAFGARKHLRPLPQALSHLRAQDRKPKRSTGWIGYLARRLLQLLFVAALVVAGRPVLAGLYLLLLFVIVAFSVSNRRWIEGVERPEVPTGQWVVYQAFRFAFRAVQGLWQWAFQAVRWCVWIPLIAAVAACLLQAGVRLAPRLRRALGLPRGLAYGLYAKPYRRVWNVLLPTGFWLVSTALALGLVLDGLPVAVAETVSGALWGTALALLTLSVVSFVFVVFAEDGGRVVQMRPRTDWPREIGPYLGVLLRCAFLGALCFAGEWILAGLYLAMLCIHSGAAWLRQFGPNAKDGDYPNPFPVAAAVIGMGLVLVPFVLLVSPALLPMMAFERWSDIRTARRLREAFGRPGGFVYFLYAEPHQRENFLRPEGVLGRLGGRVVARDWRSDIRPVRDGADWQAFRTSAEGRLLRRFEISRQREDLPFIAVVGPGNRLRPFHLSKAYRARRRDHGRALGEIEGNLRVALAQTFSTSAQRP